MAYHKYCTDCGIRTFDSSGFEDGLCDDCWTKENIEKKELYNNGHIRLIEETNKTTGEVTAYAEHFFFKKWTGKVVIVKNYTNVPAEHTEQIEIDFHTENDLPDIGEVIERDGKKYRVISNAVRNVATLELMK